MPAKVILKVSQGPLQGQEFVFDERMTCFVGRGEECQAKLPKDREHQTISRHHCLLDINPPDVRIRDFGSLNATIVNGTKIGQRDKGMTAAQAAQLQFPEYDLKHGDTVQVGNTVFTVQVHVPTLCSQCSGEIAEGDRAKSQASPGVFVCATCQAKTKTFEKPAAGQAPAKGKACSRCGRDVSAEVGSLRHGDYVCGRCQGDPMQLLKKLLELARTGRKDLLAIQGYEVQRELGRGGMGAVYLARHEKTGESVALKVMLPQVAADQLARDMFLREVENTRALRHPNVVQLRDAGCSEGTFFFTLEFCDGGSVDRVCKERGILPIDEAAAIVLPALRGLEYTHQAEVPHVKLADGSVGRGRGLVHRDLKPHNLFLAGSGKSMTVKVGDYGLAKAFDQAGLSGQTCTGRVAGTPVFMPRQQVVNFKYAKPDVDVWAMAACFYFLVTGHFPRDFPKGKDPWQVVLQTSAVPIRDRNAKIPPKIADVIDQALIDKPKITFQTAAEFRKALEGAM